MWHLGYLFCSSLRSILKCIPTCEMETLTNRTPGDAGSTFKYTYGVQKVYHQMNLNFQFHLVWTFSRVLVRTVFIGLDVITCPCTWDDLMALKAIATLALMSLSVLLYVPCLPLSLSLSHTPLRWITLAGPLKFVLIQPRMLTQWCYYLKRHFSKHSFQIKQYMTCRCNSIEWINKNSS